MTDTWLLINNCLIMLIKQCTTIFFSSVFCIFIRGTMLFLPSPFLFLPFVCLPLIFFLKWRKTYIHLIKFSHCNLKYLGTDLRAGFFILSLRVMRNMWGSWSAYTALQSCWGIFCWGHGFSGRSIRGKVHVVLGGTFLVCFPRYVQKTPGDNLRCHSFGRSTAGPYWV